MFFLILINQHCKLLSAKNLDRRDVVTLLRTPLGAGRCNPYEAWLDALEDQGRFVDARD